MVIPCPSCGQLNRVPASKASRVARCGKCQTRITPISDVIELGDVEAFNELMGASLPVLVDFWAAWCAPCRMVAPEMKKVAAAQAGKLIVAKVNTDDLPELARSYQIDGLPTMVMYREGREVRRIAGAQPAAGIQAELGL